MLQATHSVAPRHAGDNADPIFALIEAHRAALAVVNNSPWEPPTDAQTDAETEAAWAVLDCRPTTLAGALSLIRYAMSIVEAGSSWPEYRGEERAGITPGVPTWSERVLATVADAIEAITKPKPAREGDVISGVGAAVHFAAEVHEHIDHLGDLIHIVDALAKVVTDDGNRGAGDATRGTYEALRERHKRLAEDHQALRNIVCGI